MDLPIEKLNDVNDPMYAMQENKELINSCSEVNTPLVHKITSDKEDLQLHQVTDTVVKYMQENNAILESDCYVSLVNKRIHLDEKDSQIPEVTKAVVKNLFPIPKTKLEDNGISTSGKKVSGVKKMICDVSVDIPVEPNECQVELISKVITAIKNGQNCLLESPTGTGKTLALLCGALAMQQHEQSSQSTDGLVTKHKKRRLNSIDSEETPTSPEIPCTPLKGIEPQQPRAPQKRNIHMSTSLLVPTIYYAAPTHKQLKQAIKEFSRTTYCGQAKMTILSSRQYSCIRDFDTRKWSSKEDMCRFCIKLNLTEDDQQSNCKYYDNRTTLNRNCMPPAFDIEDLVSKGKEIEACPYYAAINMSRTAQIVFCPYNYLINSGIRTSLGIDLQDQIVIVDEAHNIEDICRDEATYTFTKDDIQAAIEELETVSMNRHINQDVLKHISQLLQTLQNWEDWFENQLPFLKMKFIKNGEAVHLWQVQDFVQTLNSHNIGQEQYSDFVQSCDEFCKHLRGNPRTFYAVTQTTITLFESLRTALGYLFDDSDEYMEDFKPALVGTAKGRTNQPPRVPWGSPRFNEWVLEEIISLRLMCMNPAVVFSGLKSARSIILASGTLTPWKSFESELDADFPLQMSGDCVIPEERIWIRTLSTCPDGRSLKCTSYDNKQPHIQDALGQVVLSVSRVTPHGVICFLPSYQVMNALVERWIETDLWQELSELKELFLETRNSNDHSDNMKMYYEYAKTAKGAILFTVYRGKVVLEELAEQARVVIAIGVPYPNISNVKVQEKMEYNNIKSKSEDLLCGSEWLEVQAFRALNQAVGRCVRHRGDWVAVLLVDERFTNAYYTEYLSKWTQNFLKNKHLSYHKLVNGTTSLETFIRRMQLTEAENDEDVNGTA